MRELGILAPVEVRGWLDLNFSIPDPDAEMEKPTTPSPEGRSGLFSGNRGVAGKEKMIEETAYRFVVQFCWQQITAGRRLENRAEQAKATEEVQ